MFERLYYKVEATIGSLDVYVDPQDMKYSTEREAVGHAAWCKLFENEKDKFGNLTNRPSSTAKMLRSICDQDGVKATKDRFVAAITFTLQTH